MARRTKVHAENLFKNYPEENLWATEVSVEKSKGVPTSMLSDVEEYILWKLSRKRDDLREAFEAGHKDTWAQNHIGETLARAEEAFRLQEEDLLIEVMR